MNAVVGADEAVVGRQQRLIVARSEVDRAEVAGRVIAEGVLGRHHEVPGQADWRRGREASHAERAEGGRVDRDAGVRSRNGRVGLVGGGQGLRAGRFEGGAERVYAVVAGEERVVRWQGRAAVAAGEMDGAEIP